MKYLHFFNYLIRHKWYVFLECCRYGIPWLGITHDMSKLLPGEFIAYANYYYENHVKDGGPPSETEHSYVLAWLKHQKRNRHHWQWWILHGKDRGSGVFLMPEKYIKEMVADWRGAGLAQGQTDILAWYHTNKNNMILHPSTRKTVEQLLFQSRVLDTENNRNGMVVQRLSYNAVETQN